MCENGKVQIYVLSAMPTKARHFHAVHKLIRHYVKDNERSATTNISTAAGVRTRTNPGQGF
jgi:hypothetical protein